MSTVDYIPRTVMDYGTLLCWAENMIGSQSDPCVFHLVPVHPPPPVTECSVNHLDITSVNINCYSSSSSSSNSSFVLELRRTGEEDIILNITSESGDWSLDDLDAGQEYKMSVLTKNTAGVSSRYNSSFLTFHQTEFAESRVHLDSTNIINNSKFVITPILGALIGVGVALVCVTIAIIIIVYCKSKRQTTAAPRAENREKELLSPDVAPRKILCNVDDDDDESGFEQLYSDRRYSSLNRQLCNKNIFIVVRKQWQAVTPP